MSKHIHVIVLPQSARPCSGAIQFLSNRHDEVAMPSWRGGNVAMPGDRELVLPRAILKLRIDLKQSSVNKIKPVRSRVGVIAPASAMAISESSWGASR